MKPNVYLYGPDTLPGELPELDEHYRPLNLSPKIFSDSVKTFVPINFISQDLTLSFDVLTNKVNGKSIIQFEVIQKGYPYFELKTPVLDALLNNGNVATFGLSDPDGQNQNFWALDSEVEAGFIHQVELSFELFPDRVSFGDGGVKFLTSMTDVSNVHFFEDWGPVGFEDDAFSLTLHLKLLGSTSSHKLFSNGQTLVSSADEWTILFPSSFTKSSFYIHLTNSIGLSVATFKYQGIEKEIPVTVYSSSSSLTNQAVEILPELFKEFETDFGPYAHSSFTAYLHTGGGGMEYAGATISSLGALDHELFHSWFARGVMPADGRSGWIDEAMASWRDNGYFRANALLSRGVTNLSNFSPFRKSTPSNSYKDGRYLLAELDLLFANFGGMKPLMREFFGRYKNRVVTNEEFWNFLSSMTLTNIDRYFHRYTLGIDDHFRLAEESLDEDNDSHHPHLLTQEEILSLR